MQSLNKNEALQRLLKEEDAQRTINDVRRDAALTISQIASNMMDYDDAPLDALWEAISTTANAIWNLNRYGI